MTLSHTSPHKKGDHLALGKYDNWQYYKNTACAESSDKKKRVTAGEETEETIPVPGERKATERNDI